MKHIIKPELDAPESADTGGYNAWDFFPSLEPGAEYDSREQAESEAMLAYLGCDEYGVGAVAVIGEMHA